MPCMSFVNFHSPWRQIDKFWYRTLNCSIFSFISLTVHYSLLCIHLTFIFSPTGILANSIQKYFVTTNFILYVKLYFVMFYWMCKPECCFLVQKLMPYVVTAKIVAALLKIKLREVLNTISLKYMSHNDFLMMPVFWSELLIVLLNSHPYLLNYLLTYLLTHSFHGAESFLRNWLVLS